jgi:(S)-2-hydroxyglutarate dehydrogenase
LKNNRKSGAFPIFETRFADSLDEQPVANEPFVAHSGKYGSVPVWCYIVSAMNDEKFDIAIVGGGIVGLGTALAISRRCPGYSLAIIEKESELASHQTGHNSGVIHSGIYYKPGSYKARLCVDGVRLLKTFCRDNGVRYEECGKIIVATCEAELPRLQKLYERGVANGVEGLEILDEGRAKEVEPHAKALRALRSPTTSIVDFKQVADAIAARFTACGGRIFLGERLRDIKRADGLLRLETVKSTISARNVINCAGLHADVVTRMMGLDPGVMMVPFRGEYYSLRKGCGLIRGLIYPVPDPQFPFLGVHFTRRIHGDYEAGPNAVLAFAREGYRWGNVNLSDLFSMLRWPGFWAMARRHWRMELFELYRSASRRAFLRALQKLGPDLEDQDLQPGGSGVRCQTVTRDGALIDDFQITEAPNAIHVLNAPSPAATASLAIGNHLAGLAARNFSLT